MNKPAEPIELGDPARRLECADDALSRQLGFARRSRQK
jgi:hypothetical protein